MRSRPDDGRMQTKTDTRDLPILYVKRGCPWCDQAIEFLDANGVSYRQKEVTSDAAAFGEMQKKSGQTKAPTLDWHGKILADFGTDELVPFLRKQNVKLEDS
jgi:glutaredoxin 3